MIVLWSRRLGRAVGLVLCAAPLFWAASARADITYSGNISPANPNTWNATTTGNVGIVSGDTATITVNATGGNKTLTSNNCYLGFSTNSSGNVTISGNGSTWTNNSTLYLGYSGLSNLTIINGGQFTNNDRGYLGYNSSSTGAVSVTGAGSSWTNSSLLFMGYSGLGNLTIANGGTVNSYMGLFGYNSGSMGAVTVTGAGSTWTSVGLQIGSSGTGNLTIANGGQVTANASYLGLGTGSVGNVAVTGVGSTWTNDTLLCVGYESGTGTLRVENGGIVTTPNLYAALGDLQNSSGNGTINTNGWIADTNLVFDAAHGAQATVSFGTEGSLNLNPNGTGILGAGYKGTGTLTVRDGEIVTSTAGYLGYNSGSTGTATVTGAGSSWTMNSELVVGRYGTGYMTIANGGQVSSDMGYISEYSNTGNVTVTGNGSTWTNNYQLYVGASGIGYLTIANGGQVNNTDGHLGESSGSQGNVTVIDAGSIWKNNGTLYVGWVLGATGNLTIANGGKVTAQTLVIYNSSTVNLHVSGNDMIVLGDTATVGFFGNHGTINLYANTFLSSGIYTPISEFAGRTIEWYGTPPNAFGGTWDDLAKTFTVPTLTPLYAGETGNLTAGMRMLITDNSTCQVVGASFGAGVDGKSFSASLMTPAQIAGLQALLPEGQSVLSGWNFTTDLSGSTVLLSYDLGLGANSLGAWHYDGATWTSYAASDLIYDSSGLASFTVSSFSGYALTGVPVPEPATLGLLGLGLVALMRRQRRKGAPSNA